MAKILLVEDDNNLREIYEARLQAEGYDIVSAKDGEEALVIAKKERPDLIIADVMMPRVSGFEMLDILRNTPELKDVHVIMLTALGQAEDKTRADSLGADRYLVKSQVTLEDIVKAAADVLAGAPTSTPAMVAAAADGSQAAAPAPAPTVAPIPVAAPPLAPADTANASVPAPITPQDASAPPVPNISIPVAIVPDNTTPVVAPAAQPQNTPVAQPIAQDVNASATIPEPSATDSQLVAAAVDNLVAGTGGTQDASAAPVVLTPVAPVVAPAAQPQAPATPTPPLTMQPVIAPPVAPTPVPVSPQIVDNNTTTTPPPSARKAIQPPPPGTIPGQSDLTALMAKEGHTLDEGTTDAPAIFSGSHMPGNVISPVADGQSPPSPSQTPTDPNSISL